MMVDNEVVVWFVICWFVDVGYMWFVFVMVVGIMVSCSDKICGFFVVVSEVGGVI